VGGWVVGAAWPVGLQGGGEVGVMTMAATHFVVLGPSHIGSMVVVVVVVVVVLGPPPGTPPLGPLLISTNQYCLDLIST
jgi:hypothetical protein